MRVVPATGFTADALAACFTEAFENYLIGSMVLDAATLPRFLARQGAELSLSRCVVDDAGALLGLCFVGAFGDRRRRVGGMGLRPAARGTGAARRLLRQVVDDAREAGCDAVELEVFAQNEPAVRLYRSEGFDELAPLWGFERAPGAADGGADTPKRIGLRCAGRWLLGRGHPDLPYQVSGHAVAGMDAATTTAWRLGRGLLMFTEPAADRIGVAVLNDLDPAQRDAERLLRALVARFPRHTIRVPQLVREDVAGGALRAAGFVALPLHQLQMRKCLAA